MTEEERAGLQALLADPERVEVHGTDRIWRAHLVGAVMAAAALSFGQAHAASAAVLAPQEASIETALRRAGAQEISTTTRSTQVAFFPFVYGVPPTDPRFAEVVDGFVRGSPGLLPPVNGGIERTGTYIRTIAAQINALHAWGYATKSSDRTGCVILVTASRDTPDFHSLMEHAGINAATAAEFEMAHEAAHCAQYSEGLAAMRDLALGGKVRPERFQSNLLDVRFERLLKAHAPWEQLREMTTARTRSSERYADAFAVVSMLVRGALTLEQLEGIVAWRTSQASKRGHDTAGFLVHLRDSIENNTNSLDSMRSSRAPGFDAQAVAAFLKPIWKAFEMRELEAEMREADQHSEAKSAPSIKVANMTTASPLLTQQERAALELMLQAPEVVEVHGSDKAWQQALAQVTSPAQPKPSLHEALRHVFQPGIAPAPDAPRG